MRRLRHRYGRTHERTTICVLTRSQRVNTAPGGTSHIFEPGDRFEVGGPAANKQYLIVYRAQRLGEGWKRLGPFAIVHKDSVTPERKRRKR